MSLSLATYNIHRCYGADGHYQPARIRRVLRQLDAEVIALQEVELLHNAPGLLDFFCEQQQWRAIPGLTMARESGHYGNALLTKLPISEVTRLDLSLPGREPRGALLVSLRYREQPVRVVATHLGLRAAERRIQIRRLLQQLQNYARNDVVVLMGDLNEWSFWGCALHGLRNQFRRCPAPASYPARFPLLSLDRVMVRPRERLTGVRRVKNPLTREASDHLPVVANLSMDA